MFENLACQVNTNLTPTPRFPLRLENLSFNSALEMQLCYSIPLTLRHNLKPHCVVEKNANMRYDTLESVHKGAARCITLQFEHYARSVVITL